MTHLPSWTSFLQVLDVKFIDMPTDTWKRVVETWPPSTSSDEDLPVFFAIDTVLDDAFLHWQCESAVFLHYWNNLKEVFPNLRVLLNNDRIFKRITLKAYNISDDRIVFGGSSSLPRRNLCILPPPHIMDESIIDVPMFSDLWSTHILFLYSAASVENVRSKTIDILTLPRQTRENFKANDRVVPETKEMCEWTTRFEKGKVLNTDTITDFLDQVRMIATSRVIITDYGSSFYVNGSLATDSLIVVANRPQVNQYRAGKAIESWILSRGNRIVYVPKFSDAFSLIETEISTS